MTPKARRLTEQRRRNVLDLVDQDGQVTVADLVKRFSISAVTVRTDLDALLCRGSGAFPRRRRASSGSYSRLPTSHEGDDSPRRKNQNRKGSGGTGTARRKHHSRFGDNDRGDCPASEKGENPIPHRHHERAE